MRKLILINLAMIGFLLSACGGQMDTGVTPAPNKLTFLFFYTDG